jgi:protein SCO1/2
MTTTLARRIASLAMAALLVSTGVRADDATLKAGVFDPPRAAPDFTLRGSDGRDVALSRYRGKVVILFFGFTNCPQVCPTTLSTLASAHKQLDGDGRDVQVVYVTVDPERDDVARLHDYLGIFDSSFIGLTGTAQQLEAVRRDYGVFANKVPIEGGYSFSHSSFTYLIDRAGNLRALMPYGQSPDAYVHDVRILLGRAAPGRADTGS